VVPCQHTVQWSTNGPRVTLTRSPERGDGGRGSRTKPATPRPDNSSVVVACPGLSRHPAMAGDGGVTPRPRTVGGFPQSDARGAMTEGPVPLGPFRNGRDTAASRPPRPHGQSTGSSPGFGRSRSACPTNPHEGTHPLKT
jgi:hypothetical protein